jgi:CHAT domain-containing protein
MSLLLFGCDKRADVLTGSQILDLKLNGQLVVLSACDTDVGDTLFGEGNDSLASSFLLAGAAGVVATRWRVRDDVPTRIMEVFYDELSRGESVEKALRTAKISYASKDRDPRNWAAFTILGNGTMKLAIEPRRIERLSRSLRNNLYIVLVVFAAITIVTFIIVNHRRSRQRS